MSAKFTLNSSELFRDLRRMGMEADEETEKIVEAAARQFAADLPSHYPSYTGNLRKGVRLSKEGARRYRVRNVAYHVHLYEFGTVSRYTNETGAKRGTMPARPTFVPQAILARERMMAKVAGWLRGLKAKGFSGSPDVRQS